MFSMIEGKVWGTTQNIFSNNSFEFHRIEFKKDSECSKHKHLYKWNGFFVERGRLLIRVWKNSYDLIDQTILRAGEFTKVKPGEYHQFKGLDDGVAFEIYWAEFNHEDIERESVGKGPRGYTEEDDTASHQGLVYQVGSFSDPISWNAADKQ